MYLQVHTCDFSNLNVMEIRESCESFEKIRGNTNVYQLIIHTSVYVVAYLWPAPSWWEMSPNFDILRYAHQVTEFLMGFPMIPQLCSGVIPFRNYEMIKTTYRRDCCRNTFRENGLWKKDSAHTLKKIIHIVYWVRSASRRSVTSVFTKRPWHWNCPDYVFLLLSRYFIIISSCTCIFEL